MSQPPSYETYQQAGPTPAPAQQAPAAAPAQAQAQAQPGQPAPAAAGGGGGGAAGLFGSILSAANKGLKASTRTIEKGVRSANEKLQGDEELDKFYQTFELPESEQLLADFPAKAITAEGKISGTLYMTRGYLCLRSHENGKIIKAAIPLSTVSQIVYCVAVTPQGQYGAPPVLLNPNDAQPAQNGQAPKPNAVQIYTRDNMLHQFYSITGFHKFQNMLKLLHDINN